MCSHIFFTIWGRESFTLQFRSSDDQFCKLTVFSPIRSDRLSESRYGFYSLHTPIIEIMAWGTHVKSTSFLDFMVAGTLNATIVFILNLPCRSFCPLLFGA